MHIKLLLARSGVQGFQIYLQPTADRTGTELPHTNALGRFTAITALGLALRMGIHLGSPRLFLIYEQGRETYYGCLLTDGEVAGMATAQGWNGWVDVEAVLQGDQFDTTLRVLLRWRTREEFATRWAAMSIPPRRKRAA